MFSNALLAHDPGPSSFGNDKEAGVTEPSNRALPDVFAGDLLTLPIKDWVEDVRRRVEAGGEFQDAVREVLAANAQLLVLARRQRRKSR